MTGQKKTPPAKEQHPLKWLLGMKETDSERMAREARQKKDAEEAEKVRKALGMALQGYGTVKKVVKESEKKKS